MIIESGPVEWILILLSIFGISVGIHRMITIKKDILVPEGLVDDVHNIFADGVTEETTEEAINVVSGDPSMLGEVLAAALDKKDFGFDAMNEAAEAVGSAEHNKYMTQISLAVAVGCDRPDAWSVGYGYRYDRCLHEDGVRRVVVQIQVPCRGDIGGAMITTATGLIIAIPMMFFFFFLRARVNRASSKPVS